MLTNNNNIPYQQVSRNIFLVPLEAIEVNRYQVRVAVDMEHVQNVAASIEASIMMQVPQGRLRPNAKVELIYGQNRFYAHQLLAQKDSKYNVMEVEIVEISDEEAFRRAAIENYDRAGLTVSDQIHTIDIARNQFGFSNKKSVRNSCTWARLRSAAYGVCTSSPGKFWICWIKGKSTNTLLGLRRNGIIWLQENGHTLSAKTNTP